MDFKIKAPLCKIDQFAIMAKKIKMLLLRSANVVEDFDTLAPQLLSSP
jgi:hypothetical protein